MPEAAEPLEVIAAESERLEELARGFARFGRLPEGPVSEIDLVEMLDYLLRSHLPPGIAHRLRAPADLPRITGYHEALARAFANLLLNAAEAMGGEGEVTVELAARGEALEARVLDTGPGIRAADLERIWDPDFTTKSRGTGLGLGLVRQTIHAHGGHGLRPQPAGGRRGVPGPAAGGSSVVGRRSSVPRGRARYRTGGPSGRRLTTRRPTTSMPTILIVDDEPNIRRMLGSLLRAEGYQVREAGSAREGLVAIREAEPDAMLMDLVMPGATGLDVLPEIRAAAPELPVDHDERPRHPLRRRAGDEAGRLPLPGEAARPGGGAPHAARRWSCGRRGR
jgi:hypothetical protein